MSLTKNHLTIWEQALCVAYTNGACLSNPGNEFNPTEQHTMYWKGIFLSALTTRIKCPAQKTSLVLAPQFTVELSFIHDQPQETNLSDKIFALRRTTKITTDLDIPNEGQIRDICGQALLDVWDAHRRELLLLDS